MKSLGKTGRVIKSEEEVGGQKDFKSEMSAKDTDGDGMPDAWETKHKLNPTDTADGKLLVAGGYSNLEVYLNELVK